MSINENLFRITDDIEKYINRTIYIDLLEDKDIKAIKKGYYYNVNFDNHLPVHGWKIHLSAIPKNAVSMLQTVSNYCFENKVDFKFLLDDVVLEKILSKAWDRSSSGKFITVYPQNKEHFIKIIEDLYNLLRDKEGSYILSDRRYKDCKVLYYRYGRIYSNKKTLINGVYEDLLIGPNNETFVDNPTPYFNLPSWVSDPFPEDAEEVASGLKEGRYTIEKVIHMSNSGGVYLAFDNHLNNKVVLKEARPHVSVMGENIDSIQLRKTEAAVLSDLKLQKGVPMLYDSFYEWEHFFLVVEYIEGQDVIEFVLSPKNLEKKKQNPYTSYIEFIDVFIDFLEKLNSIHQKNVTIGDLTPYNLRIDSSNHIHFLDLELAISASELNKSAFYLSTPGFRITKLKDTLENRFTIDIEAAALVMLSFFCSTGSFFTFSPKSVKVFISELEEDNIITYDFGKLIKKMVFHPNQTNLDDAIESLKQIKNINKKQFFCAKVKPLSEEKLQKIFDEIYQTFKEFVMYSSENTLNYKKNLDEGVLTSLLMLKKLNGKSDFEFYSSQLLNNDYLITGDYSLLKDSSGIICILEELGENQYGKSIYKNALKETMVSKDYTLGSGKSGFGLLAIFLYRKYKNQNYLDDAISIGREIALNFAKDSFESLRNIDGRLKWGFYEGISGISYFLTELYKETQEVQFLNCSKKLMDLIIASSVEVQGSFYLNPTDKCRDFSPYLDGAAGAFFSLISLNETLKSQELEKAIEKYYNTISYKYAKNPNYKNGLSGIGQVLLKSYEITSDKKYLNSAEHIAKSILLFQYKKNEKLYFPNSNLFTSSFDYANGMSGVADFLINFYRTKYNKKLDERTYEHAENKNKVKTLIN